MSNFLKRLFNFADTEPKKIVTLKNETRAICIKGNKNILILPGTILHIHLSEPMQSNNNSSVDINGRLVNCQMMNNKILLELDTSTRFCSKTRKIFIFPKSWDGYCDVWINGFHIDYHKANKCNNSIKAEVCNLYLLSDGENNKLFLSGLESTFMINNKYDVGVLKSIDYHRDEDDDYFDPYVTFVVDCSVNYRRNVRTLHAEKLDTLNCVCKDSYCILSDSTYDKDYKEIAAVMDIDIVMYFKQHLKDIVERVFS